MDSIKTKNLNDRPIGVFDSGIGGLTVAGKLHERLPGEDIIYLGDTARVPYGIKSGNTVKRYAMECALFLLNRGVKVIVAACNTVSAVALQELKDILRIPIIGVVEPGVKAALHRSRTKRIGVIGTPSTVSSRAYQNGIRNENRHAMVWANACPLLVPMAEENRVTGDVVEQILSEYLHPLFSRRIDTLVLGCTHYPLFKPTLENMVSDKITLVDSAETVAGELENVLLRDGLLKTHGAGTVRCYLTDVPPRIIRLSGMFFGSALEKISRCVLD